MNKYAWVLIVAITIGGLCASAANASELVIGGSSYGSNGINLDHGDVVIHGHNGTTARITPSGAFYIAGKPQAVSAAQRQQLTRYVGTVEDMRAKGLALASAAGHFAGSIVSEVLGGLFGGASEAQIDHAAHERAHDFKQRALPICQDAQTLKQIQDSLAASLPAFRPYAVIEGHAVADCERSVTE